MDIALALGGGGIKGIAHIGVIDRLETYGFQIRAIAGTSAGGLVGAAYAAGNRPLAILEAVEHINPATMYRREADDGPSLLGHAGLVSALTGLLANKTFADLEIPFACTAVDLNTSTEIYLRDGNVLDAATATMAVPGILPPFQTQETLLVDGGVLDPVPICLARLLAPNLPVVAVALSPAVEDWPDLPATNGLEKANRLIPLPAPILQSFARMRFGHALHIFAQSMEISAMMVTELRLKLDRPDAVLRPDVSGIGLFDAVPPQTLVEAGRREVDTRLQELKRACSWQGRFDRFVRQVTPINELKILRESVSEIPASSPKPKS